MYIHVKFFKIYTVCVIYTYINKQHTYIYYVTKTFILDAINRYFDSTKTMYYKNKLIN